MIRIFTTDFKFGTPFSLTMTKKIMDKLITHKPSKILDNGIIYNIKIVSLNTTIYTNLYLPAGGKDKNVAIVYKLHTLLSYSPVKTINIIDGLKNSVH